MPDWRRIVSEKLGRLRLPTAQKEAIAAELASHLEEVYEEQRQLGSPAPQAFDAALSEVFDWTELTRRIHNAKREERIMNDRTRQLWLPGLASFWAAMIYDAAVQWLGFGHGDAPLRFGPYRVPGVNYVVWLIAAFACGALGAYLSRRAGGARSTRTAAALFTSVVLLVAVVIVITIGAVGRATGLAFTTLDFTLLIQPLVMVILIPSAAMLVGALPFLAGTNLKPAKLEQSS
ncbi:MAG: hypothetical protein ACRD8A_10690 [Candidatus Acidiferrales bacterium]